MGSEYTFFVSILLLSLILTTVSGTSYEFTINRDDNAVNKLTLNCRNIVNGDGLSDPKWLFNGTDYSSNPCTQNATTSESMLVLTLDPECEGYMQCGTVTILSAPRRLLTYPTRTPNFSSAQQTINLQTGDNVVVPCEVRVSATGNFEVEWRRITFNGDLSVLTNVTLDSNYGLILKNLDISDTGNVYTCVVTAVTGDDLNLDAVHQSITGRSTKLNITTYTQPRITSKLDIMRLDNGGVRFMSSAEASGVDEYRWLKNNVEIRESTNVTIVHTKLGNMIRGTLEFSSFNELKDRDIIKAVINNTNIRGQTMEDSDRAVLFTISPSTCITCITTNGGTSMTNNITDTTTEPVTAPFTAGTTPGTLNIVLASIISVLILIIIILVVAIVSILCFVQQSKKDDDESRSDDELVVVIGENTIRIKKSNLGLAELLRTFDDMISSTQRSVGPFDNNISRKIAELKGIINTWEIETLTPSPEPPHEVQVDDAIVPDARNKEAFLLRASPLSSTETSSTDVFDLLLPAVSELLRSQSQTQ